MTNTFFPTDIDVLYAAHTGSCTFLLDADGICRRIVVTASSRRSTARAASRCVGAQYVASLDGRAAGGLVEMPRPGAAMLFARVDDRGRVSLVRTGIVTGFESKPADDPFLDSGTVETSAPKLDRPARPARAAEEDTDPDYDDSERTQRMRALGSDELSAGVALDDEDDVNDMPTAEYCAAQEAPGQPRLIGRIAPPPSDVQVRRRYGTG